MAATRQIRSPSLLSPFTGPPTRGGPAVNLAEEYGWIVRRLARLHAAEARAIGLELEDLKQEGFLALVQAGRSFDPARGAQFATWAYRLVRRAVVGSLIRNRRQRPAVALSERFAELWADPRPEPSARKADASEANEEVGWLLGTLPEKQRETVRLYYGLDGGGGRSQQAVGLIVGLSQQRVQQLVAGALVAMRAAGER